MSLLNDARNKINEIDQKMIELFKERMDAVKSILKYKKEHNLAVFDNDREIEIFNKNINILADEKLNEYYEIFFDGVLKSSKKYQEDHYE